MPTTCSCVQIFSFYKKINKNYKKHTHNLLHLDMVAPETPQKSEKGAKQNVKPEDVSGGSAESAASLGQRNHGDPEDEQPRSATLQTEKNGTERPQLNGETETPDHQKTKSVQMVESPETKKAEHTKEVNLIDLDGEVLYENKKEETTSGTSDSAEEALICRHTTRNVRKCAHNFVMGITDISPTADCNVACGLCHACKKCVDNYNMSSKSSKSLGQPIPGEKEGEGTIPVTTAQTEEVSGDSAKSAKSLGQPIPTKQEDEGTISGTTETEDVSGASAKSDKTLGEPNPAKQKDEQQTEVSGDGTKSTVSLGQPNPTKQEDVGPRPAMVSQTEDVSGDSTETKSLDQPIPAKQDDEQPRSVMTQTELVLGDGTKSIVNLGQPNAAKQEDEGTISAMAPQTEDIGTTPDHQKKTRRVGFCNAEAFESPEPKKAEDTKEVNFMDMEGGKEDATSSTTDGAEKPLICRHKTPKVMKCAHVFAMRIPEISSTADCKKTPNPCHTCTDCVDNYKNSSKDDKEREKKNEKGDSLPRADSVSPDSKSSGAKNDSEKSKETDSSEKKDVDGLSENAQVNAGQEECNEDPAKESEKSNKEKTEDGGQSSRNSCEDPDATLCYPDIRKPSECIIRLSNAGLYELQSQVKVENDDLQKATPSFFIEHQQLQGPSKGVQKKVQMEMVERVDIEKGEPESKPLIRNHRSMSAEEESVYRGQMCCRLERSCVKAVGSFLVSIIVFPPLIYAAYAWLPFDAPVMPDIPTRLVYTLRCGAFASFPIVLGVIIHGISRLCVTSFDPFKPKEREVKIHRHFVKQTTFLFVLYLFNMAVLSTYLPQSYLKLIPLLTCVFALSQLIYWLSFAVGRSFRGFGYGLMFMPLLIMLSCNLCFIFLVDPEKMVPLGTPKERVKSGP